MLLMLQGVWVLHEAPAGRHAGGVKAHLPEGMFTPCLPLPAWRQEGRHKMGRRRQEGCLPKVPREGLGREEGDRSPVELPLWVCQTSRQPVGVFRSISQPLPVPFHSLCC